jgi:hypothetical protein
VFAAGGTAFAGDSDVVDIYTESTSQWTTATLTSPRYALAACSLGDFSLFGGGAGPTGRSTRVDIFQHSTGEAFLQTNDCVFVVEVLFYFFFVFCDS